jgi:hypothetical protein
MTSLQARHRSVSRSPTQLSDMIGLTRRARKANWRNDNGAHPRASQPPIRRRTRSIAPWPCGDDGGDRWYENELLHALLLDLGHRAYGHKRSVRTVGLIKRTCYNVPDAPARRPLAPRTPSLAARRRAARRGRTMRCIRILYIYIRSPRGAKSRSSLTNLGMISDTGTGAVHVLYSVPAYAHGCFPRYDRYYGLRLVFRLFSGNHEPR